MVVTLLGTVNHIAITVSDLDEAMKFFGPLLDFLGFSYRERGDYAGTRIAINLNPETEIGLNIWEAKGAFAEQQFDVYAPGFTMSRSTQKGMNKSMRWPNSSSNTEARFSMGRASFPSLTAAITPSTSRGPTA